MVVDDGTGVDGAGVDIIVDSSVAWELVFDFIVGVVLLMVELLTGGEYDGEDTE